MISFLDTPIGGPTAQPAARADGAALARLASAFLGRPDQLAKLADPRTLVVTTGQQPGLFTGPLYTIHKALSARAVAQVLARRLARPVVPVFWAALDDHDYAEAAPTYWLTHDGALSHGTLPPRPAEAPQAPLSREPLGVDVDALLSQLRSELPDGPARERTVAWLARHFRPGATIGHAYRDALAELVAPLGVLVFDPTHPVAKAAAAPLILRAIEEAAALDGVLATRAAELSTVDLAPDVKVGAGAALAFVDGPLGRDRLIADGGGFRTRRGGAHWSRPALAELAATDPGRLSANVLLRPVVESALLPTVAYLAGPGELAYLRLAESLYQPLGVVRQTPLARWSGVWLEARVVRTLDRLEVPLAEALAQSSSVETRIVRRTAPADFEAAFRDARTALGAAFDRLEAVARTIDVTMERPAQSARHASAVQINELEKRLVGAQKRRHGELLAQWTRVQHALTPLGKPQERVLTVASFLGRYGFEVLDDLASHIERWYEARLDGGAP